MLKSLAVALLVVSSGCAQVSAARREGWVKSSEPATAALQAARFEDAQKLAQHAVDSDPENSIANSVLALSLYRQAMHDLVSDVMTLGSSLIASAALNGGFLSTDLLVFAFQRADERLAAVDSRLAVAAKDPAVALELCLACWEVDWNRNGEVDDRDRKLLEVERDAQGELLPEGDPHRRPTFRFDVADVHWLRALVAFQRAALNLAQGWDWASLGRAFLIRNGASDVRIPLRDAKKVQAARELILQGLAESEACRVAALHETDDEREWLPNPRQKRHAIPLEVDDALYETWARVVSDGQKLLKDEEALPVTEMAQLGRHHWDNPPRGFVHLGAWLKDPHDLVISPGDGALETENVERLLTGVFGAAYSLTPATASQLPTRLERMNKEVKSGHDSFERKLRYLLWIN